MSVQETSNKLTIKNLVKNYFGLDESSLKLFNHRLVFEPLIAPEYKKILGEDLRTRRILSPDLLENFDVSWGDFKLTFPEFFYYYRPKYSDYVRNKILINKNEVKLKKALEQFYTKEVFDYEVVKEYSPHMSYGFLNRIKICVKICVNSKSEIVINCENNSNIAFAFNYCFFDDYVSAKIKPTISEDTIEYITKKVEETFQNISKKKQATGKLELVLSCNFADWFLCSTGESWTSCLNLNSSYDNAFWAGLPGLIGDKNRALLYITNGKTKECFGIKTDKMLYRAWIFTVREKNTRNKYYYCSTTYPSDIKLSKFAEQLFGFNFKIGDTSNLVSRYYSELFFHDKNYFDDKISTCIYTDGISYKIAKKNKAKYAPNQYTYFKMGDSGAKRFTSTGKSFWDSVFYYTCGLEGLIKTGTKATDYYRDSTEEEEDANYAEEEMEAVPF